MFKDSSEFAPKEAEAERLRGFWNSRYDQFDLRESGIKSLPREYSELLYRCKEAAYRKAVVTIGRIDTGTPVKILDGGCGQGFFASLAHRMFPKVHYTGVDISLKAISFLKERFPEFEWICADMSDQNVTFKQTYDISQSVEVLHLILNDDNHTQAVTTLAAPLSPNGILILTDTLPSQRYFANEYIVFRPPNYYMRLFDLLHLELIDIFPMYYWIPDMGMLSAPLRRLFSLMPPEVVYVLDRLCLSLHLPQIKQSHDSKMKMIVCRKVC